MRGLALVALDRGRWPRLNVRKSSLEGDDQWRPWLREATGEEFIELLKLLRVDTATVGWK